MRKYIKVFLFTVLLLTCSCYINSIGFDADDARAMKDFFESKGLKNVTVDKEESAFYRINGKLKAKAVVRFDFVDIYELKGEKK
jgi:hypothetical protein